MQKVKILAFWPFLEYFEATEQFGVVLAMKEVAKRTPQRERSPPPSMVVKQPIDIQGVSIHFPFAGWFRQRSKVAK